MLLHKFMRRCTRALYSGRIEDLESLSSDEIGVTFSGMSIVDSVLEPDTTVYDAAIIAKVSVIFILSISI